MKQISYTKKSICSFFLIYLLAGMNQMVFAQSLSVNGTVQDETGEGITGVNVMVTGTSNGTSTDTKGFYSMNNLKSGSTLVFSCVGYNTQEVKVGNSPVINITLSENRKALEEIVVVGYGSMEKKKITSAIVNVKSESFNKGNVSNPIQLLQGRVAGLNIVAPQGDPNGTYNIRLRGLSTVGENTKPLIIIDGVIGADLNSVDPNDIASIDVLKDGGAAAIYGTRGSTGVILITTKTGKKGRAVAEYRGYLTVENKDRSLSVMEKDEYLANGGTDLGGNTNWMKSITRTAITQAHNLSLSGGTDQTSYMASLNYRDAEGVLLNTGFNQLNGRLNLSQKMLNDKLVINLNLSATSKKAELGFQDAFRYAMMMPPTAPIYSDAAYYTKYGGYFQSEVSDLYNPYATVQQNIKDQETSRLMYNIQADYQVMNGLTASVRYAHNNDNTMEGTYISKYSYYGNGVNRNGLATRKSLGNKNDLFEMTGNYTKNINKLNMSVLGGYSYQKFTAESFRMEGGDFLSDAFTYNNFSASSDFKNGKGLAESDKESNTLIAFFGRVNVNYADTYFLTASVRQEGSSRFGSGNKWGTFPGISAGVDISKLVDIPYVNQLKVRASYGVTGALPAASYLSQQLYKPSSDMYFMYNGKWTLAYIPKSNPNPNLKWERKNETDLGLDFSMFDSRLNGSFDYYDRTTNGALIELTVPVPPNLNSKSLLNAGVLKNKGFEISLSYDAIKNKNFSWTPGITFATFDTKVVTLSYGNIRYGINYEGGLPAPLSGDIIKVEEGKPIGQIYGYVYQGVDSQGQYILKDVDKSGTINSIDREVIGHGLPKGEVSFSNMFRLHNFDLSFLLRGVYGHDLLNLNRMILEQSSRAGSYNLVNTKYFNPAYKGPSHYNSHYVEDGSFIKLDNFSLGYTYKCPASSAVSSVRAYISGQNLFYITGYTGVDPEPRYSYNNSVLAPGIEPLNSWVTTRSFTFGINVSF